jgi:putative toxin-antitoxin system antitoxin component (TIGR02293 family)
MNFMPEPEEPLWFHEAIRGGAASSFHDASELLEAFASSATETFKTEVSKGVTPRFGVSALQNLDPSFTRDEIAQIVIPKRTLARRIAKKEPLTVEETDRVLRLARIGAEAQRVFGNPEKAGRWLRKPSRALAGRTPISLLKSETGAQIVQDLLNQLAHGMFI